MQPDDFAAMVVLTVKTAMAPVLERLAVAEQRNQDLQARVVELSGLRDRVTAVETKAAMPAPAVLEPVTPAPVDLGPIMERVVTLETKAATPTVPPVDLSPVLERVSALELGLRMKLAEATPIIGTLAELTKDMGSVRERIAVVEVRAQVPGPAGKDGPAGPAGKDGADGVGFNDLSVEFDGDRTLALKFVRGDVVKSFPLTLPFLRYLGVYQEGKTYDVGDAVTWGGAMHYCKEQTITKPGDSRAWQLCVKQGRDGRDGKDAPTLPVLSVGARS